MRKGHEKCEKQGRRAGTRARPDAHRGIDKVSREKVLNDMEKVLNAMLLARRARGCRLPGRRDAGAVGV